MAVAVAPALATLDTASGPIPWWFTRGHPVWNLHLRTANPAAVQELFKELGRGGALRALLPELHHQDPRPFGGPIGTAIALDLACADSAHYLSRFRPADPPALRAGWSAGLVDTLFASAGLDATARAALSARLADTRPPSGAARTRPPRSTICSDTAQNPAGSAAPWREAFATAGSRLASAERDGHLTRPLTGVLTALVAAHWNRLALAPATPASRGSVAAPMPTAVPRQTDDSQHS
ncbi:hypothetical protein BL253_34930 [Pseudofrankia asymbiotica]|uniref:Thiopeptide-type bacteriocin biosynthesis domain-containing protein n=2 Tax=Pseudofrankia asymbiotica TaxID=1834516 RepID=A0A1V2I0C4_9ACTN|nr:hypothetical protein BL253_34930 [Pseudofrankia asymbiotica]